VPWQKSDWGQIFPKKVLEKDRRAAALSRQTRSATVYVEEQLRTTYPMKLWGKPSGYIL